MVATSAGSKNVTCVNAHKSDREFERTLFMDVPKFVGIE